MNVLSTLKTLFVVTLSINCSSQQKNCNQKVRRASLKNKIPKEVCIPNNYVIRDILSQKDLNNDGLEDFVFSYSKEKIKDTDTLYVGIYTQKSNKNYVLNRSLGNLFPMFLDNYNSDIHIKKSDEIMELYSYSGNYPLNKLEFLRDEIIIDFNLGVGETMELHFIYNSERNNWLLEWGIYESKLTKIEEEILEEKNDFIPIKEKIYYNKDERITITEFNYFDWI